MLRFSLRLETEKPSLIHSTPPGTPSSSGHRSWIPWRFSIPRSPWDPRCWWKVPMLHFLTLTSAAWHGMAWLILEFPASYARSAVIAQVQHGTFSEPMPLLHFLAAFHQVSKIVETWGILQNDCFVLGNSILMAWKFSVKTARPALLLGHSFGSARHLGPHNGPQKPAGSLHSFRPPPATAKMLIILHDFDSKISFYCYPTHLCHLCHLRVLFWLFRHFRPQMMHQTGAVGPTWHCWRAAPCAAWPAAAGVSLRMCPRLCNPARARRELGAISGTRVTSTILQPMVNHCQPGEDTGHIWKSEKIHS